MKPDRPTNGSGDRITTTTFAAVMSEGPEVGRLMRLRLVGIIAIWALGLWWLRHQEGIPWLLHASAALSLAVSGWTAMVAKRDTGGFDWVAEIHVAADLVILPAFVLATGGHRSPFAVVLMMKSLTGAMLVGQARARLYALATIAISLVTWVAGPLRAGTPPGELVPQVIVAVLLALLGVGVLQAAWLPLEVYRNRRRELVRENRRLEETIAELETQNRRMMALHGLGHEIASLGGLHEVAVRLRDAVTGTFPGYAVSFFLFRRESGWLEPVLLPHGVDTARVSRLGGVGGTLLKEFLDVPPGGVKTSDTGALVDPMNVTQVLVPLRLGEKPVGLMVLEDRVDGPMDVGDAQLLATMGSAMAVALRNAELHARTIELRESMESLIENANALILVVGPQGVVEVANRALTNLVQPARDPVGRPVAELFTPESADELARSMEIVRGGAPVENLTLLLRGEKGDRRAAFNLAPVQDRTGGFRAAIAVGQDVTRLELLERGIVQSEKLASLGQFVAGIAHEINNPLTAITAYGSFLRSAHRKDGSLPADAADKLDNIVFAGERIQGFVQSLLGLARPSTGAGRAVDLNGVVRDAVRLCHYDMTKSSVEVETTLAADLPAVKGVTAEMQQVFINLFTNAGHAMPEGGGKLTIRTESDGEVVRVVVADDGSGIPAATLPHIFEAFYTTKAEGIGTGLGLSIVKKIIEQHGGSIAVSSTVGAGTMFTIELPAAISARAHARE